MQPKRAPGKVQQKYRGIPRVPTQAQDKKPSQKAYLDQLEAQKT